MTHYDEKGMLSSTRSEQRSKFEVLGMLAARYKKPTSVLVDVDELDEGPNHRYICVTFSVGCESIRLDLFARRDHA